MRAARGIDQLPGYSDPCSRLADAAFEHITNAQLLADLLDVDRLTFEGKARVARDDEQRLEARQCCDDVLDDSVREVLLLGIARHILERQHRYGGFVGQSKYRRFAGGRDLLRCALAA